MAGDNDDLCGRVIILEQEIKFIRETTKVQAIEYERRLQELNHSHRLQAERNSQYISREYYDVHHEQLENRLQEIDRWRWISIGMGITGGGLVAMLLKLLGL